MRRNLQALARLSDLPVIWLRITALWRLGTGSACSLVGIAPPCTRPLAASSTKTNTWFDVQR
ncbi:hypothetical protein SAMN05661093_11195 [Kibdelosporangium aridum]|uniref:Uncharacterized protein n=1 Tax=Kibdelosporangium aridum TaxID=2030 RepID=A0A1Y5YBV5_KIBAR|nr:hypothetical protein SAMN05661093_11195 [Kibdelosporangium aridum]